jgi:hypothetical protein
MKAGTQVYDQCLLDCGQFRLLVEKRIDSEKRYLGYDFHILKCGEHLTYLEDVHTHTEGWARGRLLGWK